MIVDSLHIYVYRVMHGKIENSSYERRYEIRYVLIIPRDRES